MTPNIDLSSFEPQDTLNPAIFDSSDQMLADVRKKLSEVSEDFKNDLKVSVEPQDIWLIGSNANYNWSDYSDVDVHIILPYEDVSSDTELVEDYLQSKKTVWNNKHDIKIGIYPIEMFVQDAKTEPTEDGGIYSIMYDSWIRHPEKSAVQFDPEAVQDKVDEYLGEFRDALQYSDDPKQFQSELDKLSEKLRKEREKGLKNGGEFSPENLAFKYLRRLGIKDKINSLKNRAYDISKSVSHGATISGYGDSEKQRMLSGNKAYVQSKDDLTKYSNDKKKNGPGYSDGIFYSIHGVLYSSLRAASKKTGEKKSTIQYRVHSKNPKYIDYKVIYKK